MYPIDLAQSPFSIVPDDPSVAVQNTAGINAAILQFNGTGAVLQLPTGDIYVDRKPNSTVSIDLSIGKKRLTLKGHGRFSTRLIQQGNSFGAQWDCVVLNSCSMVEATDFGIEQGVITNPSPIDHNALIALYGFAGAALKDINLSRLYFGSCIGDAIRTGGDWDVSFRLLDFTMRTQGHPQGSRGLGLGSRSGIAIQRGLKNVEIGHGYIEGAKNSPIDMEPSGTNVLSDILIHDLIVDNSLGQTGAAISLTGLTTAPMERVKMRNVITKQGTIIIQETKDCELDGVTVYSSGVGSMAPGKTDAKNPLLYVTRRNDSLKLRNVNLIRDVGSDSGQLALINQANGKNSKKIEIRGGEWRSAVSSGASKAYVEIQAASKPTLEDLRLDLQGVVPGEYGVKFRSGAMDIDESSVQSVRIKANQKLSAAVIFGATNGTQVNKISVSDLKTQDAADVGVMFDNNGGSGIDPTPILQGCDFSGCLAAWATDHTANGNVAPITSGNR